MGVSIIDADTGELVDNVASQQGGGDGSAYVAKGGKYSLQIKATGSSWKVEAYALPDE